jgi:hypothetical protein
MAGMAKTMDRSAVMNRGARRVWLIGAAMALSFVLGGCAGDDETPPGLYSEPCDNATTCAEGLTCLVGICSQQCTTMMDCRMNLGDADSVCIGGVCQEPCNPTDFDPCPAGLSCKQSSAGSSCLP